MTRIDQGLPRTLALGILIAVPTLAPWIPVAHASENLELEQSIGKMVIIDNERRALEQTGGVPAASNELPKPGEPEAPQEVSASHNVAILPQLGYDPEAGFIFGGKFSDINFGDSHMNLDIGATQSTGGETSLDVTWGAPHLWGSDFIGLVQLGYHLTPTQDFYGLGNNGVGEDSISTHENHATSALFTVGRRLAPHLVAAATIGYDRVTIGPGKLDDKPATTSEFSDLPGIQGGYNNPVGLSLIYNTQRDVTRPTKGWNVVGKVQHIGAELGNDFRYTRYLLDASYVHPVFSPDHILGVRVDGEYVDGRGNDLPFYQFASLGGVNTLEGFYPNRFLGQSRLFAEIGYRTLLADFDFYNIWRVRLDGDLFAGAGKVFLNRSKLPDGLLAAQPNVAPGLNNSIQYSYGGGLSIALSEALVARLDAGFSRESQGLIYLTFGNRF